MRKENNIAGIVGIKDDWIYVLNQKVLDEIMEI